MTKDMLYEKICELEELSTFLFEPETTVHDVTYKLSKEKAQEVFILDFQMLETTQMDVPDEEDSLHTDNRT